MEKNYLIDIGSSTVKTYIKESGKVTLICSKTFDLKTGFTKEAGITNIKKKELF